MRTVDADTGAREAEQGFLLWVIQAEGFEASEDYGVVGDDNRVATRDSFVGNGARKINGEKNGGPLWDLWFG